MKLLAKFLNSQQISLLQKIGLDSQVESILQALKNFEINHDQASHQIKKLLDSSCQGSQETIDLHFGGEDHIETHHPNEILQAEAINLGCHLSRFWVHNKYLIVDGQKMSKSLGNVFLSVGKFENTGFYSFETPPVKSFSLDLKKAIIKKYKELKIFNLFSSEEAFWAKFTFSPLAYRLMLMEHSYTEQLNFTWQKFWQSTLRLWNLRKDISNLRFFYQDSNKNLDFEISEEAIQKPKKVLLSYLQDNLDTPKFLEKYQNLLSETVNHLRQEQKLNFTNLQTLKYFEDNLLQFNLFPEICSDLNNILEARQKARQQKNYQQSDSLRNQILKLGFQVEDYTWGSSVWLAI